MKIDKDLQGKRIRIRNYTEADLAFVTDMWFDRENGKYMSDPTREYVDESYQRALDTMEDNQKGYYLVITLVDTGEPVGSCCIFPQEEPGGEGSIDRSTARESSGEEGTGGDNPGEENSRMSPPAGKNPVGVKKVCDIGYCIHKKYWRRGYGSEVIRLMLDWMKEKGTEKVTAEVAVDNLPSGMLLRKFGFQVEKETQYKKHNMDIRFDSYIYARML